MPKAIVVGGSLSGLFAGLLLRSIGWDVDVYERSPSVLESRGGGIVLQPEVVGLFVRAGLNPDGPVGVWSQERAFLADDGSIRHRIEIPQKQTSWNAIYQVLRLNFPAAQYHRGATLKTVGQTHDEVVATFEDGRSAAGDLLIGADGASSTVRQLLFPSVRAEYAGYVAWRGLVAETALEEKAAAVLRDRFAFYELQGSHMLSYLVAAEDLSAEPGKRRYNWVWYRTASETEDLFELLTDREGLRHALSVPSGELSPEVEQKFRQEADDLLCFPMRSLVAATRLPFVHTITDLSVRHMVQGRVALVGEAAFVARPHTASSTSKAAANVLALIESLAAEPDVREALLRWEPSQLKLGEALVEYGKRLWERSDTLHAQFH